ncbi:protein GVQW3 [Trichonephila clavipes]|nr:protein GVQW3 [Trichonephila clavipes]
MNSRPSGVVINGLGQGWADLFRVRATSDFFNVLCSTQLFSVTIEQRIVVKFHFKLGKTATETYNLLKEVYGSECLSRARVSEWFKRFKDGRQDVEDDSRPGRPSTSKTDENVEKVASLIRPDRRLSIRAIAETINIDKECVRQILHDNLNMQKVCAKMVPKILTFEQQATRKNVSTDILDAIKNDPNLLEKVITCDESWFFTYDPETKRQSMHWKTPTSQRAKEARMSTSKFKAMMIVFFDIHGIVYLHWVSEGQTINQHYYLEVKSALKGTRFESVEAVKEKAARVLKELTKDDFQHCFQQWKIRMERCRDREGVYIEGDNK